MKKKVIINKDFKRQQLNEMYDNLTWREIKTLSKLLLDAIFKTTTEKNKILNNVLINLNESDEKLKNIIKYLFDDKKKDDEKAH